jgi:hypothetical protein
MSAPVYAIVANLPSDSQRDEVHQIVKENANGWWHAFGDLWIVGGKSAKEWRDLVGPIFPTAPSGVIVLKIDREHSGTWASQAKLSDSALAWLKKNL